MADTLTTEPTSPPSATTPTSANIAIIPFRRHHIPSMTTLLIAVGPDLPGLAASAAVAAADPLSPARASLVGKIKAWVFAPGARTWVAVLRRESDGADGAAEQEEKEEEEEETVIGFAVWNVIRDGRGWEGDAWSWSWGRDELAYSWSERFDRAIERALTSLSSTYTTLLRLNRSSLAPTDPSARTRPAAAELPPWSPPQRLDLRALLVHPSAQRRGVGRRLLGWGMDVVRRDESESGLGMVRLMASPAGRRLYERVGFVGLRTWVRKEGDGEEVVEEEVEVGAAEGLGRRGMGWWPTAEAAEKAKEKAAGMVVTVTV